MLQFYRDPQDDIIAQKAIREQFSAVLQQSNWGDYVFSDEVLAKGSPVLEKMACRLEAISVAQVRQSTASPAVL